MIVVNPDHGLIASRRRRAAYQACADIRRYRSPRVQAGAVAAPIGSPA